MIFEESIGGTLLLPVLSAKNEVKINRYHEIIIVASIVNIDMALLV